MALYLIYSIDRPGAEAVRKATLEPHVAYLKSRGEIVLAGAKLSDDGETPGGSCFIVNVADRAAAQAFSDGDPFSQAGLFDSTTITRVRKGIWNPDVAEGG